MRRLHIALEQGLMELTGRVGVFNAPADISLDADLHLIQSFYPDYARLKQRGLTVIAVPGGPYDSVIIQCHKARAVSFDLLHQALKCTAAGAIIAVNGAKTDGIESIVKELRKRIPDVEVFSKAHGKLAWFTRPKDPPDTADWQAKPQRIDGDFETFPGVFSADSADQGSKTLIQHLPELKGRIADLGAGWGYLSRHILASSEVTALDLIEAEYHAIEAAKINIRDTRAGFYWADALTHTGKGYDVVVMNPPFHTSRTPDPTIGQAFIAKAASLLAPRGDLWMVANRKLPYEQSLADHFHASHTIAEIGGFKVVRARKPNTRSAAV